MIVKIPYSFTTLNQYINAERSNRFNGAKIKRDDTELARLHFIGKKIKTPCRVHFEWHVKDMRTDPDNISSFGTKVILDGAVKAKALPDDSIKHIKGFTHEFVKDDFVGVVIRFEYMGD